MRPNITINRRHLRTQQLLGHVMRVIEPYIPNGPEGGYHRLARELEELFHVTGAYIVTDADRADAGLPMRDHYGLTLEELKIMEAKMLAAMLLPHNALVMPDPPVEPMKRWAGAIDPTDPNHEGRN